MPISPPTEKNKLTETSKCIYFASTSFILAVRITSLDLFRVFTIAPLDLNCSFRLGEISPAEFKLLSSIFFKNHLNNR